MNHPPRPLWRFLRIAAFSSVPGLVAVVASARPGVVALVAGVVGGALETAWRTAYPAEVPAGGSDPPGP